MRHYGFHIVGRLPVASFSGMYGVEGQRSARDRK